MVLNWFSRLDKNEKPTINPKNTVDTGINYPSKIDNRKTFAENIPTIALNILYIKEKEKCPVNISKIISNC